MEIVFPGSVLKNVSARGHNIYVKKLYKQAQSIAHM
jgi:hypothetical protein